MDIVERIDTDIINEVVGNMPEATTIEDHIAQGLAVETACYEKTMKVLNALNELRDIFKSLSEKSKHAIELFDFVKDSKMLCNAESGEELKKAISPLIPLAMIADRIGDAIGVEKLTAEKHFERNIQDLRELKGIIDVSKKIDLKEKELAETELSRQKPIFRELRRLNLQLANSGGSILNGHFRSPNCPDEIAEGIYGYVKHLVEESKKKANILKKVV